MRRRGVFTEKPVNVTVNAANGHVRKRTVGQTEAEVALHTLVGHGWDILVHIPEQQLEAWF